MDILPNVPFTFQLNEIAIPRNYASYYVNHCFTFPLDVDYIILDTDEYDKKVWPRRGH